MGLDGDNHAVRCCQSVNGNHTQGRHTVDQHHIVVFLCLIDIGAQSDLPAHGVYQTDFQLRQFDVGRHKVYALAVVQNALIRGEWLITDDFSHDGGKGGLQAVLILPAQAGGEVALWVCVDEQHLFPQTCKSNAQVDRRGRFACAAFLIG